MPKEQICKERHIETTMLRKRLNGIGALVELGAYLW